MQPASEIAAARFKEKYNCAQSVLAAFAEQLGIDERQALRLTSIFGGGIARRGAVCGAVTGGLMALGLAKGAETPAGKEDSYRMGQEFLSRFESLHGTMICRELLGCDISTPAGQQQAKEKGVFDSLCPLFVRDAARIVQAMLSETDP